MPGVTQVTLLPLCAARGVGVLVGGVFNSGVLAAPHSGARYDDAPASASVLRAARELDRRCAAYGVPLAAAALRFPLPHPAVTGVVVGAASPVEGLRNAAHAELDIPERLWADLDAG